MFSVSQLCYAAAAGRWVTVLRGIGPFDLVVARDMGQSVSFARHRVTLPSKMQSRILIYSRVRVPTGKPLLGSSTKLARREVCPIYLAS